MRVHSMVAVFSAGVLAACGGGGGNSSEGEPASGVVIGPSGGTVRMAGVTLDVPAGAVQADTTIRVVATTEAAPSEFGAMTPLFRFEPAGTTFSAPVKVTFPAPAGTKGASIYWSRPGGGFEPLRTFTAGGALVAMTTHFSTAFLGTPVGGFTVVDASGAVVGKLLGSSLMFSWFTTGAPVTGVQVYPNTQLYTVLDPNGLVWNMTSGIGTVFQPEPDTFFSGTTCSGEAYVYWTAASVPILHGNGHKLIAGTPVTAAAAAIGSMRQRRAPPEHCVTLASPPPLDWYFPIGQLVPVAPPTPVPPLSIE